MGKKIVLLSTSSTKEMALKPLILDNLGHSSEMRNDALMHREGLKGQLGLDFVACFLTKLLFEYRRRLNVKPFVKEKNIVRCLHLGLLL